MNAKRQTVWLVSMLSLMVVLSAYYLFSDNGKQADTANDNGMGLNETNLNVSDSGKDTYGSDIKTEETSADQAQTDGEQLSGQSGQQGDKAATGDGKDKPTAGGTQSGGKTDEQVLKQLESQSSNGKDLITSLHMKRKDDMQRETERLMKIITDSSEKPEAVNKANDDIDKIEQKQAMIENLEGELMKDFEDVAVMEESNKWKVYVQSTNLEKSQVVTIIDTAMSELEIPQGKEGSIVVQRVN